MPPEKLTDRQPPAPRHAGKGSKPFTKMASIGRLVGNFVLTAAAWIATPFAAAATAAPTDNERATGAGTFIDRATCADPVRVDYSYDIVIHTFFNAAGDAYRMIFTGTNRITFTDIASGTTYSPNSSGPGTVDLPAGTTWVRGRNGAVFLPDGTLVSAAGRIIYDADGNIISIVGQAQGVCQTLGTQPGS
jgi:hypothetical protein